MLRAHVFSQTNHKGSRNPEQLPAMNSYSACIWVFYFNESVPKYLKKDLIQSFKDGKHLSLILLFPTILLKALTILLNGTSLYAGQLV